MPYYLYKLRFLTPVHFGGDKPGIGIEKVSPSCHADTFFSAICNEAVSLYGEKFLEELVETAGKGEFLLSDLFPYYSGDGGKDDFRLCLPKPALLLNREEDINPSQLPESDSTQKKKMKKLAYIPIRQWEDYLTYIAGKSKNFECDLNSTTETGEPKVVISEEAVIPRVAVSREGKDATPYFIGAHIFSECSGLYFITKLKSEELKKTFDVIISSLQYSGIGGKRTSGYGKFQLADDVVELDPEEYTTEDDRILAEMLSDKTFPHYMALSVISPYPDEITPELQNNSFYTLIPRSGFVNSRNYSEIPLKRKSIVMLGAGSCFPVRLKGHIPDVSEQGGHPVYRYGMAMMMGVNV